MVRNYPSFIDAYNKAGQLPDHLTFTLAAMLVLYKGYYNDLHFEIRDAAEHVRFIRNQLKNDSTVHSKIKAILKIKSIWGKDLEAMDGLSNKVADYITSILDMGIREAMQHLKNQPMPSGS